MQHMKSLLDIKQAIHEQLEFGKTLDKILEKSKVSKVKKSLQMLRKAETYLMSSPQAEYIKIELDKVKRKIKDAEARGPIGKNGIITRMKPTPEESKAIKAYDKEEGINKLREFKKFLTYLNS